MSRIVAYCDRKAKVMMVILLPSMAVVAGGSAGGGGADGDCMAGADLIQQLFKFAFRLLPRNNFNASGDT